MEELTNDVMELTYEERLKARPILPAFNQGRIDIEVDQTKMNYVGVMHACDVLQGKSMYVPIMIYKTPVPNNNPNFNVWYIFKVKERYDSINYDEFGKGLGLDKAPKYIAMTEDNINHLHNDGFYKKMTFMFCYFISKNIPYGSLDYEYDATIIASIFGKDHARHKRAQFFSPKSITLFDAKSTVGDFITNCNCFLEGNKCVESLIHKMASLSVYDKIFNVSRKTFYGPYMMFDNRYTDEWVKKSIPTMKGEVCSVRDIPCLKMDTYVPVNEYHPGWYVYYVWARKGVAPMALSSDMMRQKIDDGKVQLDNPDHKIYTLFFLHDVINGHYYAAGHGDLEFEPSDSVFGASSIVRDRLFTNGLPQKKTLSEFKDAYLDVFF